MPVVKDARVVRGKINRNENIKSYFRKRFNEGARYEVVVDEIILQWGLSESTISQIVKENGNYSA
jgi:hypothetical protein